jgi:hypothetical protein
MTPLTRGVAVTEHALERYRSRVAGRPDATAKEVLEMVLTSRECKPNRLVPRQKPAARTRYLLHAGLQALFVCRLKYVPDQPAVLVVVTVIDRVREQGSQH